MRLSSCIFGVNEPTIFVTEFFGQFSRDPTPQVYASRLQFSK